MNKVLEFLEKYAQFLALGIAALFLGLVAYKYVLSPGEELKTKVGNKEVLPGEVDTTVAEQGGRLQNRIGLNADLARQFSKGAPTIEKLTQLKSPSPSADVRGALKKKEYADSFLAMMGNKPADISPLYMGGVPNETRIEEKPNEKLQGVPLPVACAPIAVRTVAGQSWFARPPAPGAAANPAVVIPAAGQPVAGLDLTWGTHVYKIPLVNGLADNWKAAFDPRKVGAQAMRLANTKILWVECERQELVGRDADGTEKWSNAVALKYLPLVEGIDTVWPANGKFVNANDAMEYLQWADKHQVDLVLPPFYQWLGGDPWLEAILGLPTKAGDPAVNPVVNNQPFDPANPPTDRPLTPDEKRQVYIYKQKQKEEEAKQKANERRNANPNPTPAPRDVRPPRGGGGKYNNVGMVPANLPSEQYLNQAAIVAQARPERPVPPARGGGAVPPARGGAVPPVRPETAVPPVAPPVVPGTGYEGMPAGTDQFKQNPALNGEFNPIALAEGGVANPQNGAPAGTPVKEITGWFHDPTAQPGRVYRYRVRYYLKNPLFGSIGVAANQADAEKVWIVSPWSDWDQKEAKVTTKRDAEFFFAGSKRDVGSEAVRWVTVDVFKRLKGSWTVETFTVFPGDSIGQKKGDVDFTTGATVIDLRRDQRDDTRIVVADDRGLLETRSLKAEKEEPLHKELLDRVKQPKREGEAPVGEGNPPVGPVAPQPFSN